MKNYLKLLLFLGMQLYSWCAKAQEPLKATWSPSLSMSNETLPFWVGADSSAFYVFRLNGAEEINRINGIPTLQQFSKDLTFIRADEIKDWHFEGKDEYSGYEYSCYVLEFAKKKWIMMPQSEDLKGGSTKHRLVARELDLKNHTLVGQTLVIQDWVTMPNFPLWNIQQRMDRLQSKLATFTTVGKERNHFIIRVLNRKMAQIFNREISLPFDPAVFEPLDWLLTSSGTFYLIARIHDTNAATNDNKAVTYSTILIGITAESNQADLIPIKLPNTTFRKLILTEDPSGTLHCFGFVSHDKQDVFEGWADVSLDPFTKNITTKGPFTFPKEWLVAALEERKRTDTVIPSFKVRDIAWRSDQSLQISGYFSKDAESVQFLAFRVDSAMQNIEAMTKTIPLDASNRFKGVVAPYSCLYFDDEMILVYDHKKDTEDPAVMACRWATGKNPKDELVPTFDGFKKGNYLLPHTARKIDNNQFFIIAEGSKRRNHWIGIVKRK